MEHDSPSLLFTLACEHMKSSQVIRLGVVKLLERVATARAEAGRETYSRVEHLLTPSMMAELDGLGLLHYDAAVRGKSTTARAAKKWFADRGLSTYTWVSDQFSTYGTKIIVVTHREAQYVLDEITGNATDLPITEHATDTHGGDLGQLRVVRRVGLQLPPRIRDLGKVTLYRTGPRAEAVKEWPISGHLVTRRLNTDLITEHWDDLLRLAGSIKFGQATATSSSGSYWRPAGRTAWPRR